MPRLIGKQDNSAWYALLVLALATAAAVYLEYAGVFTSIPGFGGEQSPNDRSSLNLDRNEP